ncbi:SixA phosphatase family protein [Palleronia sp. KMU-117]|uniref:SixA phosphatase family protein n=1 Tax=Palleronia sp. KMU-117 TaxID=3434108 RepID=UPI003D72140F
MTRQLILTRHAKSSWDDPRLDDHDRPLNGRGRASAAAIGDWLRAKGHLPDEVLVSGARRTVETWGCMAPTMPADVVMHSEPALYHAGPQVMLNVLRTAKAPVVMLIGHNPGIAEFAERIVSSPPAHPRFADYPTAATTVMDFDINDWPAADWGGGAVRDFVVPRDLIG